MTLVEITGLIGRDGELKQLNNALVNGANILLVASNGFGKTALWEHTRELADDYNYFNLEMPDTTFAKSIKSAIQEYHEKCPDKFFLPKSVVESDLSHLAQKTLRETGQLPWSRLAHFFGRINVEKAIQLLLYSFHYMKESALHLTASPKILPLPSLPVGSPIPAPTC